MVARLRAGYSQGGMNVAVATVSLTSGDRLAQDPAELLAEPIPWRSPDLTPTTLATLLAARFGERISADEAERVLQNLGAVVNRAEDTLYATAPAGARIAPGAKPRWSIIGTIEPAVGRLVRMEVRYLSGK
jgi:hypothetical protein